MDYQDKAFDFALSTTKQVVSLSTGFLVLSITFLDTIVSDVGEEAQLILQFSWGFFLISIITGVITMMAMTGNLGKVKYGGSLSVYEGSFNKFAIIEMTSFLIGVLLVVVFGVIALQ